MRSAVFTTSVAWYIPEHVELRVQIAPNFFTGNFDEEFEADLLNDELIKFQISEPIVTRIDQVYAGS